MDSQYISYIYLGIAALLPVITSMALFLADKYTGFKRLPNVAKQIIYGIIFGCLAILGTEWGIPINGAMMNCRDASVLTAGLLFGWPAGIIAGLIGGIERWFAVAWGVGAFTRTACTFSTIFAGIYAAFLRKYMFEEKKPGWLLSFAIGVVMEIFHITMVFITNMSTPTEAMAVVRACTFPMVLANALSLMLSTMSITLLAKERFLRIREKIRVSQTIQRGLFITVLLAFAATSYLVYRLQDAIAVSQTDSLLELALDETVSDIRDASDRHMLQTTHSIASDLGSADLETLATRFHVSEISVVSMNGIIIGSTEARFLGYDMASGEQSAEFLCLLDAKDEYVQEYGPISYDNITMRKYAGVKYGRGFVQVGYDASQFQDDIDSEVVWITKNRHIGNTGYILILNEQLQPISIPKALENENIEIDADALDTPEQGVTFTVNISGSDCFCRYRTSEGYYIVSLQPVSEAMQLRNIALYVNTFMEILVFAVLFALIYLMIKQVVVNQINGINASLTKITEGNLGVVVDVRTNEEFASLSDGINSTVDTLKKYIAEASARIDQELEFAKNIQASALPNTFPAFPKRKEFDIFALMDPAKEVGGDFYDFYITNTDTLNFMIADVSGKGIPAAMFMMRAKTELKTLTESDVPINEVFTRGNASLCEGNDAGMFVTAWQGDLDLTTGNISFANAGHNPPLIRHADGKFEYLRAKAGFVLAGMDGLRYKSQDLQLKPGDIIYLYTDGVTEATNSEQQLYGEARLLDAVNSKEFTSMEELCTYVKSDVDSFVGDAPQFDDITMVALKFFGPPPIPTIRFEQASIADIPAVTEFIESELEKIDCPMKTVIQINVAIDEIYSNIVKYGYPNEPGSVEVQLLEKDDPHTLYIRFTDEGIPYNPLTKEDPDITLSAEDRSIGGLGIFMVKKTMDDMKYKYEDEKNILTIMKKLPY